MIKKHGSFYWLDIRVDEKRVRRSLISSLLGHSKMLTSLLYSLTDKERKKAAVDLIKNRIAYRHNMISDSAPLTTPAQGSGLQLIKIRRPRA